MAHWHVLDIIFLAILVLCIVVWPTQLISDSQNRWLRAAAIAAAALHWLVVGPRVHMGPAYLVAVLFGALLLADRRHKDQPSAVRERSESSSKRLLRWALICGTSILVSTSIVLVQFYPHLHL